ncbi:MAG: TonB-dependent receptor [Ignavibacteriaceae bacterium]|nr:TonB-dependent receptor [Ignavibacteriaceae bacterium]
MKSMIALILLSFSVQAQQTLIISGYVYDQETRNPLISASVLLKGKNTGTVTDDKGNFSLTVNVADNDSIQISYLGYQKKFFSAGDFKEGTTLEAGLTRTLLSSQSIYVTATVGEKGRNPAVLEEISKKEIQKNYSVQDVPEYLSTLPSVSFYSDNGGSVGYNYLNIRGFDQRRIAVSVNGIPQNDPEDHNVYWINFSDILSGTDLVAVQRGSGGGISGYPAIGGAVNLITASNSEKPFTYLRTGLGSYNTKKLSIESASGIFNNKSSLYVKFSQITSSGYRDKSFAKLSSYYLSYQQFDENLVSQINVYGGVLEDGLVYTGLPKFVVQDKNLRRKNYSYWESDNKQFTWITERRAGEIENFSQPHYELLNEYQFSDNLKINSALFLVTGSGFYDYDASWAPLSYFRAAGIPGFSSMIDPDTIYSPNGIIRAMVENVQYGWIPRVSYKHTDGEFISGLELRRHNSLHWGSLRYGDNLPAGIPQEWKYYSYRGGKDIVNFFVFEKYKLSDKISLQGELQTAYHRYKISEEKFVNNDFTLSNLFLNGRFGIYYTITEEQGLHLSAAKVSREPRLKEYYDAAESSGGSEPQFLQKPDGSYDWNEPLVKPETMNAFDLGYHFKNPRFEGGVNLYAMFFSDEIVKNGDLDRFGQPRTGNMKSTEHLGAEVYGIYRPVPEISFISNFTVSSDKISEGFRFAELASGVQKIDLAGNRIAGFPEYLANAVVQYEKSGVFLQASARLSGRIFSDNYGNNFNGLLLVYPDLASYNDNINDEFFTLGLFVSWSFELTEDSRASKIYIQMNNALNNLYAAYAVGGEFYPAAERNFFFGVEIGL